jgi:RNA polymerase sigma-70 factor (ECF subfamily)
MIKLSETVPDEYLISAVQRREPEALQRLYERYHGLLRTVTMNVVHNSPDAEEILQDVFLHVWNRAETYCAERGKPVGWLVMLARRRAIDRFRQQSSYRRATLRFEAACQDEGAEPRAGAGTEAKACLDDLRSLLKQQLQRLPFAQKQAVELTFFAGMSQREIAATMKLPLGTVKTRIELGLRKLSHILITSRLKIG